MTAVYLHIGSPKSGTTYIQTVLRTHRELFAEHGVLVAGDTHLDLVHAGLAVRQDARLAQLPPERRRAWTDLVAQIRAWQGRAVVVSYELFSAASAEAAQAALRDLDGLDVHLVITARDLGRAVPSAWQERLKFGLVTSLEDWSPLPESHPRSDWGWRTLDPAGVASRWASGLSPDKVHIVTVPRAKDAASSDLWGRFAEACGLGDVPVRTDVTMANESLGAVQAEVLRRLNEHVAEGLANQRERATWLRDLVANKLLSSGTPTSGPLGATDEQLEEATQVARRAIAAIGDRGYRVHGDLADLEATRPELARTPREVEEGEVADVAVATLGQLLLWARDERGPRRPEPAPRGDRRPGRGSRRALRARIDVLEQSVEESRRLQLRVASLQDVVTELLLPAESRDDGVTNGALRSYRRRAL